MKKTHSFPRFNFHQFGHTGTVENNEGLSTLCRGNT